MNLGSSKSDFSVVVHLFNIISQHDGFVNLPDSQTLEWKLYPEIEDLRDVDASGPFARHRERRREAFSLHLTDMVQARQRSADFLQTHASKDQVELLLGPDGAQDLSFDDAAHLKMVLKFYHPGQVWRRVKGCNTPFDSRRHFHPEELPLHLHDRSRQPLAFLQCLPRNYRLLVHASVLRCHQRRAGRQLKVENLSLGSLSVRVNGQDPCLKRVSHPQPSHGYVTVNSIHVDHLRRMQVTTNVDRSGKQSLQTLHGMDAHLHRATNVQLLVWFDDLRHFITSSALR
mmetsp:Transcript_19809/g.53029  ORF Transcript_19809/g.53029 Transcript_19809/m.53029 type:complete len:286 (+) Transcript_19809:1904-2761(+)